MKLLLIVPPIAITNTPLLAVPTLSAYLKSKDIEIVTFDANLEFYYYLLTEEKISNGRSYAKERYSELKSKKNLNGNEKKRLFYYQELLKTPESILNEEILFNKDKKTNVNEVYRAIQSALTAATVQWPSELIEIQADVSYAGYTNFKFDKYSTKELIESTKDGGVFNNFFEEIFVPLLKKEKPDIIGISVSFDHQIHAAFLCARIIKKTIPDVHITLGGTFVSSSMVNLSNSQVFNLFDGLIIGDGEIPLEKLAKELESEKPEFSNVPGLIYYDGKRICKNSPAPLIPLESLPFPDFSGYLLDRYIFPFKNHTAFSFRSSRGCYWGRCRFCRMKTDFFGCFMQASPEYIVEGMNYISERTGGTFVYFNDSSTSPRTIADVSKMLSDRKGNNLKWMTSLRADKNVTLERCIQFSSAGCVKIFIGIETYNDRLLRIINKGTSVRIINSVLSNLSWAGLYTEAALIVGLPSETEEEAYRSNEKIRKLQKKGLINKVIYNYLALCPLSEFYTNPDKYGITDMVIPENWDLDGDIYNFKTDGMSRADAKRLAYQFSINSPD